MTAEGTLLVSCAMIPMTTQRKERKDRGFLVPQQLKGNGMAQSKRGPIAGTEQAMRGGQAMRDRYGPDFYRTIGKKGGAAQSARIGPEGYRAIGQKGGE